jgi:tetratricopeptide (TPR) repeat protein
MSSSEKRVRISAIAILTVVALGACNSPPAANNDIVRWLRANDVDRLGKYLQDIQRRFEKGELTEIDLRNAYRPVYELDSLAARNLRVWADAEPQSYVAHLAYGIYLKRLGRAARGDKYIEETTRLKLAEAGAYLTSAAMQLRESIPLTPKPFLSLFHLLEIASQLGDRRAASDLIAQANRMCPTNALARDRYVTSLMPRWGGSYADVDAFVSASQEQGAPAAVIAQLDALKYDDMGHALEESGSHVDARESFQKALELGAQAGGTFNADWLQVSRYYVCADGNTAPYCR